MKKCHVDTGTECIGFSKTQKESDLPYSRPVCFYSFDLELLCHTDSVRTLGRGNVRDVNIGSIRVSQGTEVYDWCLLVEHLEYFH